MKLSIFSILVIVAVALLAGISQASVQTYFGKDKTGDKATIVIQGTGSDPDVSFLYQVMNVPNTGSGTFTRKNIQWPAAPAKPVMSIGCGETQGNQQKYGSCRVEVFSSPYSQLDSGQGVVKFVLADAAMAAPLLQLFSDSGRTDGCLYSSQDKKLKICFAAANARTVDKSIFVDQATDSVAFENIFSLTVISSKK